MAIDFPSSPAPGQQVTSGSRTWTWSGSHWANNTITGVQGTQGTQGLQGIQGVQGIQGIQGEQGIQGTQGTQGTQGIQGEQGIQGTQGTQGLQGTQGTQGLQGIQGIQGTQGVQGVTGLAFTIAKTYVSVAALNADTSPSGIVAGQFALINTSNVEDADNSKIYLWDGSTYTFINDLSGTAGIQGVTGSQGTQGLQGITGAQGTQGIQGISGASILGLNNTFTGVNSININGTVGATTPSTVAGTIGTFSSYVSAVNDFFLTSTAQSTMTWTKTGTGARTALIYIDATDTGFYSGTNIISKNLATSAISIGTGWATLTSTGLNSTAIGATTPSTGAFTTLSATGDITANTNILLKSANDLRLYNAANDAFSQLYNPGGSGAHQLAVRLNGTNIGTFTSTGLAVTGTLSATGTINAAQNVLIGSAAPAADTTTLLTFQGSNLQRNWRLGVNVAAGEVTLTPSTANGGTTYTTPVVTVTTAGLAVTGALSATGAADTIIGSESGTGSGTGGGVIAATASANGNASFGWRTNGVNRWVMDTVGTSDSESVRIRKLGTGAVSVATFSSTGLSLASGLKLTVLGSTADTSIDSKGAILAGSNGGAPLVIGVSGGDYPSSGYNFATTLTSGSYNYRNTDSTSRIEYYNGGFRFYGAASGTIGSAITYALRGELNSSGLAVTGALSATGALTVNSTAASPIGLTLIGDNISYNPRMVFKTGTGSAAGKLDWLDSSSVLQARFSYNDSIGGAFEWKPGGSTNAMSLTSSGLAVTGVVTANVAKMGTGFAGFAEFSDSTRFGAAGTYSFLSETGGSNTYVNASTGGNVYLRIANADKAVISSTGLAVTGVVSATTDVKAAVYGYFGSAGVAPSASNPGFAFSNPLNVSAASWSAGVATTSLTLVNVYNGNGIVGTVVTNGSATAWNTSSDARLKTNLRDITDSSVIIDALKPRRFDWLTFTKEKDDYGFVAQEAYEVYPKMVTVGGDDPAEKPWGMDASKLIPVLVAELQSLRKRLAALESK